MECGSAQDRELCSHWILSLEYQNVIESNFAATAILATKIPAKDLLPQDHVLNN